MSSSIKYATLTITMLCALCAIAALRPIAIQGQTLQIHIAGVEALDESGAPLTIDDLTRPPVSREFRPLGEMPTTNRTLTRWYRFVAPRANGTSLVLTVLPNTSDADLYFQREDGSYAVKRFGMSVPFNERVYPSIFPALPLSAQMRGGPLYLRTYGQATGFTIQPQSAFDRNESTVERLTFWVAGFLFAIGISSLFISIYLRERTFLLQAVLMAVALVYILIDSDLAWKYLWPGASVDADLADSLAFLTYLFVLLLFARSFLSLDRYRRRMDLALWAAFALNVLITFVAQPLAPDSVAVQLLTPVINFLPFPLLLLAGALRWWDGFSQARFLTIGVAGMIAFFLAAGVALRHYFFARFGFDAGVAFDSLFFQFALADRVIAANRARDAAQRKALAVQDELVQTQQESISTLARYNEAFSRFVPHEFLTLLNRDDIVAVQLGDHVEREMVVLFSDIRSFTALSEELSPKESFDFVNAFLAQVGPVVREHGGFVDKYIGDAIMALFTDSDEAVDAAIELQQQVRRFNESRARELKRPIAVGVGLHRGPLMLGTIGEHKRLETTVIAAAVNVASHLEVMTKAVGAQIVISGAVEEALTNRRKYCLRPLGSIRVPGLSHDLGVFEVCDADEPELLLAKMADADNFARGVRSFADGDYETSRHLFESIVAHNAKDSPAAYYRDRTVGLARSTSGGGISGG